MNTAANMLLRLARLVAGEARSEWVDAMEAEASTLSDDEGMTWAMGCVWAAMGDRLARNWKTIAWVVATPIASYAFQMLVLFPTVWLIRHGWPNFIFYATAIASPLPFVWMLGRWHPNVALSAATASFVIAAFIPGLFFWASFGASPLIFLSRGATLYDMPVLIGLVVTLPLWLIAAKIGASFRQAAVK